MKAQVTYKMVGADGNEYGPVSLDEIRSWVREGRITGFTNVQRSDHDVWSTASSFPELGVVDRIASAPGEVTIEAADAADLEKKMKSGGSWFYWIAGLSLINSIVMLAGSDFGFVLGLTLTQVIDYGVREFAPKDFSTVAKLVAFVFDLAAAGLFVAFGIYARRKQSWAFLAGIILYGFDTLFTVLAMAWLGILWHGWAIFSLVAGLKAANEWRRLLREQQAAQAPVQLAPPAPLRKAA